MIIIKLKCGGALSDQPVEYEMKCGKTGRPFYVRV